MSSTTHRLAAAAVAAAVLAAGPVALAQSADAAPKGGHSAKPAKAGKATTAGKPTKPTKGSKSGKTTGSNQAKQVAKLIAVKDAYLARVAASSRTLALPDAVEAAVTANIDGDRATLAVLGESTDVRAVRASLAVLRVENYAILVELLEDAVALQEEAADSPAAAELVQSALDAAVVVTAASPRSELRAARQLLDAAEAELDAGYEDGAEDEEEPLV